MEIIKSFSEVKVGDILHYNASQSNGRNWIGWASPDNILKVISISDGSAYFKIIKGETRANYLPEYDTAWHNRCFNRVLLDKKEKFTRYEILE